MKNNKLLPLLGCLLAASVCTPAMAATWDFSYTGFLHEESGVFQPNLVYSGSFTGEDINHNGVLEKAELSSLYMPQMRFDFIACERDSNQYYHCGASNFSFGNAGLAFSVGSGGSDPEGWVSGGTYFSSSTGYSEYYFRPGQYDHTGYLITPNTVFNISGPAMVPEPETYAMLGLGLLGLMAMRRRKK